MYVKVIYQCKTLNGVGGVPTSGVHTTVIIVSLLTGILKNTKNELSLVCAVYAEWDDRWLFCVLVGVWNSNTE